MDATMAFATLKHADDSGCQHSKNDELVETLIKEFAALDDDNVFNDPFITAEQLEARLSRFRACRLMRYFSAEQPATVLTQKERTLLFAKTSPAFGDHFNAKCRVCRRNVLCLSSAPTMALSLMTGDLDDDGEHDALDAEVDLLLCQAMYVQSRAGDLYYKDMLHTAAPVDKE